MAQDRTDRRDQPKGGGSTEVVGRAGGMPEPNGVTAGALDLGGPGEAVCHVEVVEAAQVRGTPPGPGEQPALHRVVEEGSDEQVNDLGTVCRGERTDVGHPRRRGQSRAGTTEADRSCPEDQRRGAAIHDTGAEEAEPVAQRAGHGLVGAVVGSLSPGGVAKSKGGVWRARTR